MRISILNLAKSDLKEIHEYLSDFGTSPPRKLRESFEKFCTQVKDAPHMFSAYTHNTNYRRAVIAFGYLVFYRVFEDTNQIKIYRVLHSKRNTGVLVIDDAEE